MKMKEMCEDERPREKLLMRGATALSDGELLSILLSSGTREESALDVARRLISGCSGGLTELFNLSPEELMARPGIGPCKAARIMAAFELGKRFVGDSSGASRKPIVSARGVFEMMIPLLKGLDHEENWVIFLNDSNYFLGKLRLTSGGSNSTVIDIRQTVRSALRKNAAGIILVHNHPSGNPDPSAADVRMTDALREACRAMQIQLLDHVVVSDNSFFSMADGRLYRAGR